MFCNASTLDKGALDAIQALEQEIGRPIVAYTCTNPEPCELSREALLKLKTLEDKLSITLVAFK